MRERIINYSVMAYIKNFVLPLNMPRSPTKIFAEKSVCTARLVCKIISKQKFGLRMGYYNNFLGSKIFAMFTLYDILIFLFLADTILLSRGRVRQ